MKTWIVLAMIAATGIFFAVSDYQKRENERIIKLEKMRLEAQERERKEREQELERKKQIDTLNTQLADLQKELSQLTAEAEKYDVKFAELNAEVDKTRLIKIVGVLSGNAIDINHYDTFGKKQILLLEVVLQYLVLLT